MTLSTLASPTIVALTVGRKPKQSFAVWPDRVEQKSARAARARATIIVPGSTRRRWFEGTSSPTCITDIQIAAGRRRHLTRTLCAIRATGVPAPVGRII
jgi:hypothetical protein